MAISVVSFSFSRAAQPEARGPSSLLNDGFLYRILSPKGLVSKTLSGVPKAPSVGWWLSLSHFGSNFSDLQLTDFPSLPSYIIVQSPTQSLEWHVWSSSSGNNCHAVHKSLSSAASVYECTMGFYLVSYRQPSPPTRFLLITAIGMCHSLPVHHFGMACLAGSKVNIQHTSLIHRLRKYYYQELSCWKWSSHNNPYPNLFQTIGATTAWRGNFITQGQWPEGRIIVGIRGGEGRAWAEARTPARFC